MSPVERLLWLYCLAYVFTLVLGVWMGHVVTLATLHHLLQEQGKQEQEETT